MTSEKHMLIALAVSTMFIIFNIIAVIQGTAATYYSQLEQLIIRLLPTL